MHPLPLVILLLVFVVALSLVAKRLNVVQPVALTIAGLAIGFLPGLPEVMLEPSLVLLVFLPPILYSAAWYMPSREFRKYFEPIVMLALGLVIATSVGIAFTALWLLPGFTLAMGFLLGAILSPPDAVAATAVLKQVRVPKKIVSVLEGESLVNDASALIVFQFALGAVLTGQFSLAEASLKFVWVAAGGVAMGWLIGYISFLVHRHFRMEPSIEIMFTFITAYAAYLLAESIHVNGVLSVVTAGLLMGRKQSQTHTPYMRMQAVAVWGFVITLINGLVFILIGLQLPHILKHIPNSTIWSLMGYGLVISIVTTVIRFLFVFVADRISGYLRKLRGKPAVFPSLKHTGVVAFTAMRGVVSLAAAFSIPVAISDGLAFPQRDLILFVTFCTVLFTLLLQGLTLRMFIRWLDFSSHPEEGVDHETVRRSLSYSALQRIRQLVDGNKAIPDHVAQKAKAWHTEELPEASTPAGTYEEKHMLHRLQKASLAARRERLIQWRESGELDAEIYHELENELDLEESRLHKTTGA